MKNETNLNLITENLLDPYNIFLKDTYDYSDYFYERFFEKYFFFSKLIVESFRKLQSNIPVKGGALDEYEITYNEFKFLSKISYFQNSVYSRVLNAQIYKNEVNKLPFIELTQIEKILLNNPEKYTVTFYFSDSSENTKITGLVKQYTFGALKAIEQSFTDSIATHKKDIAVIIAYIDKTEQKRIKLYSKLTDRYLPQYKNEYVDCNSDSKYCAMYRYL